MPSENEMFYGIIQKGLDKWNGAFFCGSAALLRRKALQEVGGFSGISITEDCETALDLHSRGWNSLYIDKPMISGLQPETFASFIGQRSRWARGMFQIFLLKNPLFKRGLSLAQKICYLSNMMYWFFSFPRMSFFFAPLLYIFFSMHIYQANAQEFVAYTIVYMIANMLMQNRLYGTVRWPWVSELYEYVQSIYLVRGLLSVVLNPWKPTFNVTDKGQSLDNEHLSELATPYIVMFAIVLASTGVVVWRMFTEPEATDLLAVVAIWNTFNLVMAGIALGVVSERRTPRTNIDRYAELALGTAIVPVHISNASYGGCRVTVEEDAIAKQMRPGAIGVLSVCTSGEDGRIETLPVILSNRTRAGTGWALGFEFGKLRAHHYRVLADLLYTDSRALETQRLKRRKQKGVLGGILGFGRWAAREPIRGLRPVRRELPSDAGPRGAGPRGNLVAGRRRPEPGRGGRPHGHGDGPGRRGDAARPYASHRGATLNGSPALTCRSHRIALFGFAALLLGVAGGARADDGAPSWDSLAVRPAASAAGHLRRLGVDARELRFEGRGRDARMAGVPDGRAGQGACAHPPDLHERRLGDARGIQDGDQHQRRARRHHADRGAERRRRRQRRRARGTARTRLQRLPHRGAAAPSCRLLARRDLRAVDAGRPGADGIHLPRSRRRHRRPRRSAGAGSGRGGRDADPGGPAA